MLKKYSLALLLAGALALGGCATPGGTGPTLPTVAQVQAAAVAACAFLPTASTVAGILAAGNPAVSTAGAVAQAICAAIAAAPAAAPGAAAPTVLGVVVHGKFVK